MNAYRIKKYIGSYTAVMNGLTRLSYCWNRRKFVLYAKVSLH
jgi:hypothetical protein